VKAEASFLLAFFSLLDNTNPRGEFSSTDGDFSIRFSSSLSFTSFFSGEKDLGSSPFFSLTASL